MPAKYRRNIDRLDEWHFHAECPGWPEVNYLEQSDVPEPEDLCPTCIELDSPVAKRKGA